MFEVHCHIHESRVLLDWSRIESMRTTDDGPVLDWHCWCGARGSLIAGERSVPRPVDPVVVDLLAGTDPRGSAAVAGAADRADGADGADGVAPSGAAVAG